MIKRNIGDHADQRLSHIGRIQPPTHPNFEHCDINLAGRFIEHGLAAAGRYFVIHTRLTDRPGELMRLLSIISEMRINVIDVRHQRISSRLPIMQREETLTLETRDREQCEQLLQRLRAAGYVVEEAQALE